MSDYMLKESLEIVSKPDDGRVVEQFGVVPHGNRKRLHRFDYQQHQVKRCGPMFERERLEYQPSRVHGRPCFSMNECRCALLREPMRLIQYEHNLAYRRPAEIARRL